MCLHSSSYAMRYQIKFSLFKDIANLGSMYPHDVSTLYIWNRDYKKRVAYYFVWSCMNILQIKHKASTGQLFYI